MTTCNLICSISSKEPTVSTKNSYTLKMEAAQSTETLAPIHQTTPHHVQKNTQYDVIPPPVTALSTN